MTEHGAGDLGAAAVEREITQWMKSYLADLLEIAVAAIDEEASFDRYGLDSLASVGMVGDLEAWLGSELDPALSSDYPSIKALARQLASDERLRAILTRRLGSSPTVPLP